MGPPRAGAQGQTDTGALAPRASQRPRMSRPLCAPAAMYADAASWRSCSTLTSPVRLVGALALAMQAMRSCRLQSPPCSSHRTCSNDRRPAMNTYAPMCMTVRPAEYVPLDAPVQAGRLYDKLALSSTRGSRQVTRASRTTVAGKGLLCAAARPLITDCPSPLSLLGQSSIEERAASTTV